MMKNYSDLSRIKTFEERFDYLKIGGSVGFETFGHNRYLNQMFYHCDEWKRAKQIVIMRDDGNDLGVKGIPITGIIIVHHINPISVEQILERDPVIFDPEYLISVSEMTHKAIHYGDSNLLRRYEPIVRRPYDTSPWRN